MGLAIFGKYFFIIIIIIIHEFHRDASLAQNFRAAMCHVLHYSCNVNGAVADSLHCRMICGTVPSDGSDVIAGCSCLRVYTKN